MNSSDIAMAVAVKHGLKLADVEKLTKAILEQIEDGLARGEKVVLQGTGTFRIVEYRLHNSRFENKVKRVSFRTGSRLRRKLSD